MDRSKLANIADAAQASKEVSLIFSIFIVQERGLWGGLGRKKGSGYTTIRITSAQQGYVEYIFQ